jgi:hypothetical protein
VSLSSGLFRSLGLCGCDFLELRRVPEQCVSFAVAPGTARQGANRIVIEVGQAEPTSNFTRGYYDEYACDW